MGLHHAQRQSATVTSGVVHDPVGGVGQAGGDAVLRARLDAPCLQAARKIGGEGDLAVVRGIQSLGVLTALEIVEADGAMHLVDRGLVLHGARFRMTASRPDE
jgi:hypothetical protein